MDNQTEPAKETGVSRWTRPPWWVWFLIVLFPVVLKPWWVAIISLALFVLFLRLVLGQLQARPKSR